VIAKLKGKIDSVAADGLVLDVNGVGYLVFCSSRTLGAVAHATGQVALHIETHVREDHIHLYGFLESAERNAFRVLTTVQGVGARLALAILSTLSPEALVQAIAAGDRAALTQASGVGPKLATRILTELKDKVAGLSLGLVGDAMSAEPSGAPNGATGNEESPGASADAVSALVNLGYGRSEAFAAVARAARARGADAGVETLIREGLLELAGREVRA
jgi:holliday junction DNA helicase RuvA